MRKAVMTSRHLFWSRIWNSSRFDLLLCSSTGGEWHTARLRALILPVAAHAENLCNHYSVRWFEYERNGTKWRHAFSGSCYWTVRSHLRVDLIPFSWHYAHIVLRSPYPHYFASCFWLHEVMISDSGLFAWAKFSLMRTNLNRINKTLVVCAVSVTEKIKHVCAARDNFCS